MNGKTASYLILMTVVCMVIFWIFIALRPANAGWVCSGGLTAPPGCHWSGPPTPYADPPPLLAAPSPLPPVGPPPIGWVYGPYTQCADPPRCSTGVVNVQADGLNVRVTPDGPATTSLVNGTPLVPLDKQGNWLLVAAACDLTPTFAWSWTANVPLMRCWVY
jgi:hypothetical protein